MRRLSLLLLLAALLTVIPGCAPGSRGATDPKPAAREVDATEFLLAFRKGKADKYEGYTVKGRGWEFSVSLMGAQTQGPLVLTLGTIGPDDKVKVLQGWEEWSNAEAAGQPMLMIQLGTEDYQRSAQSIDGSGIPYSFSGRYTGKSVSVLRQVSMAGEEPEPIRAPVLSRVSVKGPQ